jgi:hypothetical protein
MTSFRFSLERALEWRTAQLEVEEARFRERAAALAAAERARTEMEASAHRTELEVRSWNPKSGVDLAALGSFRLYARSRADELARERAACARALAEQETRMLEARRRCRLLERLKARRLAEWTAARDRELEEMASESYLAQWGTARDRRL